MRPIARIHSDFPGKFGVPRQSGVISSLEAHIVFEPEFRNPDALRGLDGFSHLWIIWEFSDNTPRDWSPLVLPPRLGGSEKMGVFATRSPYRPNGIGLSSVKISRIDLRGPKGPVIHVLGADLVDGTPLLDIKPYLSYTDCHPEATGGFTDGRAYKKLCVDFPAVYQRGLPASALRQIKEILENDPRPHYQTDATRVYGFEYSRYHIEFKVQEDVLTVCSLAIISKS